LSQTVPFHVLRWSSAAGAPLVSSFFEFTFGPALEVNFEFFHNPSSCVRFFFFSNLGGCDADSPHAGEESTSRVSPHSVFEVFSSFSSQPHTPPPPPPPPSRKRVFLSVILAGPFAKLPVMRAPFLEKSPFPLWRSSRGDTLSQSAPFSLVLLPVHELSSVPPPLPSAHFPEA